MTSSPINVLMLGASYGSLFTTKLALAGHNTTMVCLPQEEQLINEKGTLIRLPVRGLEKTVELHSANLTGNVSACSAAAADPAAYDLIVLAMQEPQYSAKGVKELMQRVAASGLPCVSIMNMPPMPYLARLPGVSVPDLAEAYTDPSVWAAFDPSLVTLASPDPQAFRPPEEPCNVLQVGLPTNFKVARFASDKHTEMLYRLQTDIENVRYTAENRTIELPVKFKVHESIYVPLAKWLMLISGNYRCIGDTEMRPIKEAVHSDLAASKEVYDWVGQLCLEYGASVSDLVPFEKYAVAAQGLQKPSSAARALAAGARNIERVDKVVKTLAGIKGRSHPEVDAIVHRVDQWLAKNRQPENNPEPA